MTYRTSACGITLATILALSAAPAAAQTAANGGQLTDPAQSAPGGPVANVDSGDQIGDIIVTANKRAENIQSVRWRCPSSRPRSSPSPACAISAISARSRHR